jgi:pyruvate dehydrogenase E1 component
VAVPELDATAAFALHADGKEMSTTMAFVRILGNLMKDEALGPRVVPIVADEARTFGMASLFRTVGIYAPFGQLYQPEDSGSMLYYREDRSGQILEEGITEAGALSSWTAAATSYSTHGLAMLPFYIYYSMFGFQRVGDLIWAAADQRARGFLIGATAGRTTLGGEGLQHQDGSSHLVAATVPNCRAYDPATAGRARRHPRPRHARDARRAEGRLLLRHGDEREHRPAVAACRGARRRLARHVPVPRVHFDGEPARPAPRLGRDARRGDQGRGAARGRARRRRRPVERHELQRARPRRRRRRDRVAARQHELVRSCVGEQLAPTRGPIVIATDYVRAVPEQIRAFLPPGGAA